MKRQKPAEYCYLFISYIYICVCVYYFSGLILPLGVEPLLVHSEAEKLFLPSNRASDFLKQLVTVDTLGKEAPVAPVTSFSISTVPPGGAQCWG